MQRIITSTTVRNDGTQIGLNQVKPKERNVEGSCTDGMVAADKHAEPRVEYQMHEIPKSMETGGKDTEKRTLFDLQEAESSESLRYPRAREELLCLGSEEQSKARTVEIDMPQKMSMEKVQLEYLEFRIQGMYLKQTTC